jgi:glycosyltransferase involved in cell wall biosynthesis
MNRPLVSICIPTYNSAKYIRTTVNSALCQDYGNVEVIVCDDGSTDNTSIVLNDMTSRGVISYYYKENGGGGASSARNMAISKARGKFILPLDSDDIILEDCVSSLMELNHDDESVVVSPVLTYFGGYNPELWIPQEPTEDILNRNFIPNTSLYSKWIWEKVGGYDEDMKLGYEDWEFWIRVYKLGGVDFKVSNKPTFLYRRTNNNNHMSKIQEENRQKNLNYINNKHRN